MRFFLDTEFIEDGVTIDLVSVALLAEDGREFYAVSSEFSQRKLQSNQWLLDNVWPSLPTYQHGQGVRCACGFGHLDLDAPEVRTRAQIARAVVDFLRPTEHDVELWADHSAYDHVALCQLWGPMIGLPPGMPMWTNDLRQEWVRQGRPELPAQTAGVHNALEDARHNVVIARTLGLLKPAEGRSAP